MAISEKEYQRLKTDAQNAKSEFERAQGALEEMESRLKKEFKCSNLEEAEQLLEELKEEETKAERNFNKAKEDYERKWKSTQS